MSLTIVLTGIVVAFAVFAAVLAWADAVTTSPKRPAAKTADYRDPPRALAASGQHGH